MTQTTERVDGATSRAAVDAAAGGAVSVVVNGERRALPAGATVASLLAAHGLDPRLVVVEHNRVILRDRAAHGGVALGDGDVVEIVHFVGGG